VRFRLLYSAPDFLLHPDGVNHLQLIVRGAHDVEVTISCPDFSEKPEATTVEAAVDRNAPVDLEAGFRDLAQGRLPKHSLPREEWGKDHPMIDENGRFDSSHVGRVPMYLMPAALRECVEGVSAELREASLRAFGILRWRAREFGPLQPFKPVSGLQWEHDGEWLSIPSDTYLTLDGPTVLELTHRSKPDLQAALDAGDSEPLGHELLREAWNQRTSRPRSALLIGVAALEVGVKQFVSRVAPDAAWLATNAPTPPVVKMLQKYLPTLNAAEPLRPLAKGVPKILSDGVELRNRLAHTGDESDVSPEKLETLLRQIREVLWSLDAARGYTWASDHRAASESSGYKRV
jgi:hypothetical protein